MKLSDFDFTLPNDLVAQYPLEERDSARLLVLHRKTGRIEHVLFKDVISFFSERDLLVINDTKVLPGRLFGKRKSGGKVEILLLNRKEGGRFSAMLKPSRLKIGEKILFDNGSLEALVSGKEELVFETDDIERIYSLGVMPLPPYIKRAAEEADNESYQTVYASKNGAIASPTAGLHFTRGLLEKISQAKISISPITLHVGLGTFKPVKVDTVREHVMHPEFFSVPSATQAIIRETKKAGKRIFAVGTTTLRSLETYALGKSEGKTDLFIYPGFEFKLVDCLLTNFHLPKTTLFMLVCAFAGTELAQKAYKEAVDNKYRFYSYGDCMLIL